MRNAVYFMYDHCGVLIYVGLSKQPFARFGQHRGKNWIEDVTNMKVKWFNSRSRAALAERRFIRRFKPIHNRQIPAPLRPNPITAAIQESKKYDTSSPNGGIRWWLYTGNKSDITDDTVFKEMAIENTPSQIDRLLRMSAHKDSIVLVGDCRLASQDAARFSDQGVEVEQ